MELILVSAIVQVFALISGKVSAVKSNEADKLQTFVSDDILNKITADVSESWNTLKAGLEKEKDNASSSQFEKEVFWNDILLKRLKPHHDSIREIDRVVLENKPSAVLDPIVNITDMNTMKNLSEKALSEAESLEWLDLVKVGWIRISSMASQIHWKYNWIFDHIFTEGFADHSEVDFETVLNDTLRIYHAWFRIVDRGEGEEQYCLDMNELSDYSKVVATGGTEGVEKNMFHGLRKLLGLQGEVPDSSEENSTVNPCPDNATVAGKRENVNKFLPVYVLLHLLNGEFKYYLIKNLANMYNCVHSRKCDYEIQETSKKHLNLYYEFYFSGITEAFAVAEVGDIVASKIPKQAWRWRCDPPVVPSTEPGLPPKRDHKENVTYARLYDFETTFIEDERNISLTQTCRDSCDVFDGAYSSIPCEEDDWGCLEQGKNFDCFKKIAQGEQCPGKPRVLCPNSGLLCKTTTIKTAEVCKSQQQDKRYLEWIDTDALNIMGKKSTCDAKETFKISSEELLERADITKYEPQICEICLCKCYEPLGNDSHRYISLLPQSADIQNGYTLVGAKFLKVKDTIHIMIGEAKLVDGQPDPATIRWNEPKPVNISDTSQVFRLDRDAKKILLDDFVAPNGYIVTGLRFVQRFIPIYGNYQSDKLMQASVVYMTDTSENQTWHTGELTDRELGFEVQVTAINSDGILNANDSKWVSNPNNSSNRSEVKISDPDDPILSPESSLPASSTNEYVVIQSSSLTKDAGQTPVPFFDTQELAEMDALAPVRGFGLFYKGRAGYGGFLAFRLISLHVDDSPPDSRYDLWRTLKNVNGTGKINSSN